MNNYGRARYHIRRLLRNLQTPEAVESRRQEFAAITQGIVDAVDCPECYASQGELCRGLSAGYHFGRGERYARSPWPRLSTAGEVPEPAPVDETNATEH